MPIKYVYPSRLDYLTHNKILKIGMLLATLIWGASTADIVGLSQSNLLLVILSMSYLILYTSISFYRTWVR